MKTKPTLERVSEVLEYNKDTGVFTWKRRDDAPRGWNQKYAGKQAGTIERYVQLTIDGVAIRAHRVACLLMMGHWPDQEVDHIDKNRTNNAWRNLRLASRRENACNRGQAKHNTSGYKGVTRSSSGGKKWQAQIGTGKKCKYLGRFDTPEEAYAAYCIAAKQEHQNFSSLD